MSERAALLAWALPTLGLILWILWRAPRTLSSREEESLLRDYFRQRDAAERRGERWPP